MGLDGSLFVEADSFDFGFDVFDIRRAGHRSDAGARTGFVHEVDRLVGQKASGEVAVGEFGSGFERLVEELGLVVRLVFWTDAMKNLDRLIDCGGFHFDLLKTALESGILFDVFAEFVKRCRSDALHFATTEGGFDDV